MPLSWIDGSLYPDTEIPDDLPTLADQVDFLVRLCGAWDFGILPDWETVEEVRRPEWQEAVDETNLLTSPGLPSPSLLAPSAQPSISGTAARIHRRRSRVAARLSHNPADRSGRGARRRGGSPQSGRADGFTRRAVTDASDGGRLARRRGTDANHKRAQASRGGTSASHNGTDTSRDRAFTSRNGRRKRHKRTSTSHKKPPARHERTRADGDGTLARRGGMLTEREGTLTRRGGTHKRGERTLTSRGGRFVRVS